jgi:hypothetical protein
MEVVSVIISTLAFGIAVATFWLTRVRKGFIKMTRPTVIFFGPDGRGSVHNKIFIRTLLFCTADNGRYIQNMFVRLQRGETIQNFNIWVYDNNGLVRGSGLYINKSGIACNHHFLMPHDGSTYAFLAGEYLLQIFVEPVNKAPIKLFEKTVVISSAQQKEMQTKKAGIYFDWAPNTQKYESHIDEGPGNSENLDDLMNILLEGTPKAKRR